jgi:hypothetical protein
MENWHYILVLVLLVVVLWILNMKWKLDRIRDPALDGKIVHEAPNLDLNWLKPTYDSTDFADTEVSNFDISDSNGFNNIWNGNRGVGSGDAPQLSEVSVESPEFKRQMKSLIEHMGNIGYRKKIINDFINHIKDNHLSPQLILMQMKNDPDAPPPNISEDPMTD